MGAQVEADLPLDNAVDQQADDGEHCQSRNPFGFLEPHGSDGRRVLDPTKTRFYSGILVLIGVENVRIATYLSAHGRGQYHPAIVLLRVGECLHVHHQAIARLKRWWVHLGWASPPRVAYGGWRRRHDSIPRDTAKGVGGGLGVPALGAHTPRWRLRHQPHRQTSGRALAARGL